MSSPVSNKIIRIFNRLKNTPYKGTLRCQHFAVAIRGGRVITPVSYNYHRTYVFGKKRGTIHAEMNSLKYLVNTDKSYSGYSNSTSSWAEQQRILQSKVVRQVG